MNPLYRTPTEQWILLQRLAEAIDSGEATLRHECGRRPEPDLEQHRLTITLIVGRAHQAGHLWARGDSQEWFERAERLSVKYAEVAQAAERIASKRALSPPRTRCPTCDAPSEEWCRPVHAGERASRDWVHPEREPLVDALGFRVETRMHPQAVPAAVWALEQGMRGMPRAVQERVGILARSVLAVNSRERARRRS